MNKRARLAVRLGAGLAGVLLLGGLCAVLVVRSDWFQERVRRRIVFEVENATGGRAEIGAFRFDWATLQANVRSFVLHGTEGPEEPALLQATSVRVGLNITSLVRRDINIALLAVEEPRLHVAVYSDGRTNLPRPRVPRAGNAIDDFLDLAIRTLQIDNGVAEFNESRFPLSLRGEDLRVRFRYERNGPRYAGQLVLGRLQVLAPEATQLPLGVTATVIITGDRVEIPEARFALNQSSLRLGGAITNPADPRAQFQVDSDLFLKELKQELPRAILPQGRLLVSGKLLAGGEPRYRFSGRLQGSGLGLADGGVRTGNISLTTPIDLTPAGLRLEGLVLSALGGRFGGRAVVESAGPFHVEGEVADLSVEELIRLRGAGGPAWSGRISGPVSVHGTIAGGRPRDTRAEVRWVVAAEAGQLPLAGSLDLSFDQKGDSLEVRDSHLATRLSRVRASGVVGQKLRVDVVSKDLDDFLPVAASLSQITPGSLPVKLDSGEARFSGIVAGSLEAPRVSGRLELDRFLYQGRRFDRFAAEVEASASDVRARDLRLEKGTGAARGDLNIALDNWQPHAGGALSGSLSFDRVDARQLLAEAGVEQPFEGSVSGSATIRGTIGEPVVSGKLLVKDPIVYQQRLHRIRADFLYRGGALAVPDAQVEAGTARLLAKAAFTRRTEDWRDGALQFELDGRGIALGEWRGLTGLSEDVAGDVALRLRGEAAVESSQARLLSLDGNLSVSNVASRGKPVGGVQGSVATRSGNLVLNAEGNLAGAAVSGKAVCGLEGKHQLEGDLKFGRVALSAIQPILMPGAGGTPLPVESFAEGEVSLSGLALDPETWKARVDIRTFEVEPRISEQKVLALRNAGPIVLEVTSQGVRIGSARFVGESTNLEASGTIAFRQGAGVSQFRVRGDMNLAVLNHFERSLTASGESSLDATIRGPIFNPEIYGRLEFSNASFYLSNLPNGIDKASGLIFLFRDRATIENITAETGGGKLRLKGFVGYGGDMFNYRLEAQAEQVRVRYPEGVSTSVDCDLRLTGASTRSLLAGTVTVLRSSVAQNLDFAGLLASSSKPLVTAATQNELLRNMQFDVRVRASPDAKLETALTRDITPEADLHLRGTPYRPVILGRISASQGEVNFLGTRYTINRGDVSFYNPARLEPVLNLDLETRVRGIDVTINFTGPPNKLSVTYRSDPPLQPSEIIALLAVGRTPSSDPAVLARSYQQEQTWQQIGAGTIVGQALAAPVTGRLQRFFGVSRIKIDPKLTGVESNPQAQLTLEQQVSRDITFTYITNLSRTQEQIVRVEWNASRKWSVLAVREENGLFGIDILHRQQFK